MQGTIGSAGRIRFSERVGVAPGRRKLRGTVAKWAGWPFFRALPVIFLLSGSGAYADRLTYTLRPNPETHETQVTLDWRTEGRRQSGMFVAKSWGTVPDVRQLLRNIKLEGGRAEQRGEHWVISHGRDAELRLSYTVRTGKEELEWNAGHYPVTTARYFHGFGNTFLLTPTVGGAMPTTYDVIVRWELPRGWSAACSWGVGKTVGERLAVSDLRQSIYLAGELKKTTVKENGRTVSVVMVEDSFRFSLPQFTRLARKIIDSAVEFMGEKDFPSFVVTAVPVGPPVKAGESRIAGSGLYHSFALMVAPRSQLTDAVERLFMHELFHFWNGRLLAAAEPDELVMWFHEGLTDYYAMRILYEQGIWSAETFAKWINEEIREYHRNPARSASNEEIAGKFWRKRDTYGEIPYQRGLLLGLRWHHKAQEEGERTGIDRLFFELLARGRRGQLKISNEVVRKIGVEVYGAWFGREFDAYVEEAKRIPLSGEMLDKPLVGEVRPTYTYEPGFDVERSLKQRRVVGLERRSEAYEAGVREGDKLLGWRISGDPDEKTVLQIERGGRLRRTISYYPRGSRIDVVQFEVRGSRAGG